MAKHTPGPWTYNPASRMISNQAGTKTHIHGQVICTVTAGPGKNTNENAALIAAAPDMLAALEKAATMLQVERDRRAKEGLEDTVGASVLSLTRAAIAKAKVQPIQSPATTWHSKRGDNQPEHDQHSDPEPPPRPDHRDDNSGLDDGPLLPPHVRAAIAKVRGEA